VAGLVESDLHIGAVVSLLIIVRDSGLDPAELAEPAFGVFSTMRDRNQA